MKILHIVPHAEPSSISRELDMLLEMPPHDLQEVRVCCLAGETALTRKWRGDDIAVEVLNWRRWLDPRPLWALAASIREFQPDIVHAWGLSALRATQLATPRTSAAVVVRKPIPSDCSKRPRRHHRLLTSWDLWHLRSADYVLVSSNGEAAKCRSFGLAESDLRLVRPGVRLSSGNRKASAFAPDTTFRIVCAGELEPRKGFYEAIWAFDILHYVHENIELVIAGEGPLRGRLEKFVDSMGLQHCIKMPGTLSDIPSLLSQASLVWVPSLADTGAGIVLEAMAAGVPVVASNLPVLAELVIDGQTGLLIEPGGKMDLGRKTLRLLEDRPLCRQLGEAAGRRAQHEFTAESFVEEWNQACVEASMLKRGDALESRLQAEKTG